MGGASHSKKDPVERANELRAHISPALVAAVRDGANELWRSNFAAEVVTETLLHADGESRRCCHCQNEHEANATCDLSQPRIAGREEALDAVAALADPDPADENHPLFHIIINRQMKRLIREDARIPDTGACPAWGRAWGRDWGRAGIAIRLTRALNPAPETSLNLGPQRP